MIGTLRRRTRGQKPKGNQRSKVWILPLIVFGGLIVGQLFAFYQQNQELKIELDKKPKIIEKKVIKKAIEWKEKKVYINRDGKDITNTVNYANKKFKKRTNIILAICRAESGLDEKIISEPNSDGTRDYGFCQINSCHCRNGGTARRILGENCLGKLRIAENNLNVAYALSNYGKDFTPWTVYKSGSYIKYLNQFN